MIPLRLTFQSEAGRQAFQAAAESAIVWGGLMILLLAVVLTYILHYPRPYVGGLR